MLNQCYRIVIGCQVIFYNPDSICTINCCAMVYTVYRNVDNFLNFHNIFFDL